VDENVSVAVLDSKPIEKQNRFKAGLGEINRQLLGFERLGFGGLSHTKDSGSEIYHGNMAFRQGKSAMNSADLLRKATPHVKHAEDRLKREKCSSSRLKNGTSIAFRINFTAWQTVKIV